MWYKIVSWALQKLLPAEKKAIVLQLLTELVDSKTHNIDKQFAEVIMTKVVKSQGNSITAYVLKD